MMIEWTRCFRNLYYWLYVEMIIDHKDVPPNLVDCQLCLQVTVGKYAWWRHLFLEFAYNGETIKRFWHFFFQSTDNL